jgi:uncharacterized membrane protein
MARLLYALAIGVVGAAIVHIAILFLLPFYSEQDAWSRIAAAGAPNTMVPIRGAGASQDLLRTPDPLFAVAACQFNLAEGVTHLSAPGRIPYWSIAIFNRAGQNIYSLNDRTAATGELDIVIATPLQLIELRKELPAEYENSIFIEVAIEEGMVVLRGFVPDQSWREIVDRYVAEAACTVG